MCPDHKLKWFKDRGRDKDQIKAIKQKVINAWNETYALADIASPDPVPQMMV